MDERPWDDFLIGREAEGQRFREIARELLQTDTRVEHRPIVMLLWGLGGIGKSTLTRWFYRSATTEPPFERDLTVTRLDWEEERTRNPRLQVGRQQLEPEAVLDAIVDHLDSRHRLKSFRQYRQVEEQRKRAEQQVEAQLKPQHSPVMAPLANLTAKSVAALVRALATTSGVPGGEVAGDLIEQHGEAAIRAAVSLLTQRVGEQSIALVAQPHRELARALGEGLRDYTRRKPLIFIQDTYEIVDSVDPYLREAIFASGPRIMWLLVGRNNLAASDPATRFVGYNSVSDRVRLRALPETGEFSQGDVERFLVDAVPERSLPPGGAERIHRATLGIPLAVRMAAEVWRESGRLEEIEESSADGREAIVRRMAERFLIHCTDETARQRLYALALLRRPYPPLFKAMCDGGLREREAIDLLRELAQQYPFLFAADQWLHASVRAYLHEHLRHPLQRDAVRLLNTAAWRYSQSALEEYGRNHGWEERLESERWRASALDFLHHLFWMDCEEGWQALPAFFIAGVTYDRTFARSVLEIARRLDDGDNRARRRQVEQLATLTESTSALALEQEAIVLLRRLWERGDHYRDDPELAELLQKLGAKTLPERGDNPSLDHAAS